VGGRDPAAAALPSEATIVNAFGLTEAAGIASLFITADMTAGEGALPAGELSPTAAVTIVGEDGEPVATGEARRDRRRGPRLRNGVLAPPGSHRVRLQRDAQRLSPCPHRRRRTLQTRRHARTPRPAGPPGEDLGNRVELGEVEKTLARLDGVAAAASATYIDDTESTRLTACVMPNSGAVLDPRLLRSSAVAFACRAT